MIRKFFQEHQFRDKYGFRWRGGDVSRLESLTDAVFAFSVTLLIVSLEVPRTFADLVNTMKGFPAFAVSFAILLWIWHVHYGYFRRYGIEDAFTKTVNGFLLFVVLFYVYPLKFVFTSVIHFMSVGTNEVTLANGQIVPIVGQGDSTAMMVVYGIGFIAVFFLYSLLYVYALRKKEELRLSELELAITKTFLVQYVLCIFVGLISISLAVVLNDNGFISGISYSLLGPFLGINGFLSGKKIERIREKMNLNQQQRGPQGQRPQQQRNQGQGQQQRQHQRPPGQQQRRPYQQRPHQRPPQDQQRRQQPPERNEPPEGQ